MSTSSPETLIEQPELPLKFAIKHKPDADEVSRQVVKLLHEHGNGKFSDRDSSSGFVYAKWEPVKDVVANIMSTRIVTTGTAEDKSKNGITVDELYTKVFGQDAPGAHGEDLSEELAAAVKEVKKTIWGYLNKGTTGHVNHRAKDLVMAEGEIIRESTDADGNVVRNRLQARYLTANTKIVSAQAEAIVTDILEQAFEKANRYIKLVGERVPELALPLAKKSKAISASSAKKFTYADPTFVAEMTAVTLPNGQEAQSVTTGDAE
jgi:hypothetical protein